jgi:hypothetical protein
MMEKHNGYTNYATWLVALHIGQDNDDQEFYTARGRWYNNNPVIEGGIDFTVYTFGQEIRGIIEEGMPLDDNGLYNDLLGHAIAFIDWHDLAEHYQAAAIEEDEYNTV